jgi:hypothetical protein
VITSKLKENFSTPEIEIFDHFCSSHVERYFIHQRGAQGIGVLAFEVSDPGLVFLLFLTKTSLT